ncbi:MAG: GH32 C-terminal domain-containing protein [Lachnospiraceae bacterium]|nr:GH32 C-terminal domain-containing protein [Lachnospiraceae bacterium]
MSEYTVEKARIYEEEQKEKVGNWEKPSFHVTGQIGWINDPNGFSRYQDAYHLFFQYHPYSTFWGPMHWGHVKTQDFIKWEELPCALAPDQEYDHAGCFSGSAVELPDGKQLLIYTAVKQVEKEGGKEEFQQQCIAIGDGIQYEKSSLNPVIPTELIPKGNSTVDFRDPKIWREEDRFYLVVGSRNQDGSGEILLYESLDGKKWSFAETIDRCENRYGKMWECPDFFAVDGKQVLITSPQDMEAEGDEFHSGNGTLALLGHAGEGKRFVREKVQTLDYGLDYYAPQTLRSKDGRRILIAWMQNWDTCNQNHEGRNIFGQMTLPREVSIQDGRLCQNPVRELLNYRSNCRHEEVVENTAETSLPQIKGRVFDMEIQLDAGKLQPDRRGQFRICFAKAGKYETVLTVDLVEKTMTFDRSKSGGRRDILSTRTCQILLQNGKLDLRIVMDHQGIEIFGCHGKVSMSNMIYTPMEAEGISVCTKGNVKASIDFYELNL